MVSYRKGLYGNSSCSRLYCDGFGNGYWNRNVGWIFLGLKLEVNVFGRD